MATDAHSLCATGHGHGKKHDTLFYNGTMARGRSGANPTFATIKDDVPIGTLSGDA